MTRKDEAPMPMPAAGTSGTLRTSACLLALLAALGGCGRPSEGEPAMPPAVGAGSPPLPIVATSAPAAATSAIASDRRAAGTLLPRAEVTVVARARGVVTGLTLEVGAVVAKGQVLFRVDDREAGLRLVQAQTQLAAARQQHQSIEIEHRRTKLLFDQHAATQQQWDQLSAQLGAASVAIAQAQSGVALASKATADATVRAPIGGVVVSRAISLGAFVTDGTPALVLQDQASLDLKFRLPERALAHIRAGDALTVSVPALGQARQARIAIVAPSVEPRTRTVELTAVLDNRDGALRPGLMAEIELAAP
jgi:membrane fusion protein, multidrug efflux system